MKYLKVILSEFTNTPEHVAGRIKTLFHSSVKSIEICDEVQETLEVRAKMPEIKRSEVGILDLSGLPEGYQINRNLERFSNRDVIDLGKHPELRRSCKNIEVKWNVDAIPKGALIEIVIKCETYYGKYKKIYVDEMYRECIDITNAVVNLKDITSIRVVEWPR